jgi:hypothetical protein
LRRLHGGCPRRAAPSKGRRDIPRGTEAVPAPFQGGILRFRNSAGFAESVDLQNDLSELGGLFHSAVCGCGFGQRKHPVNHRPQPVVAIEL